MLPTAVAAPTSFGTAPVDIGGPSTDRSAGVSGERYVPGTVVAGRYRIVAILGRGGMGEVYRADDLTLGQPVALKFLPEALAHDDVRLKMLLDEVRVARRVAHPNACRVYDIGHHDDHTFLTMEYVDGEDLAVLLQRIGQLAGDKAIQIAREICAGLAAAHDQGIVHRDFKPANIMIDGRGRARVTDFGLAREAVIVDGPEAGAGTPAYMAPEQLAGRESTARSDIYALGLVLYELFTGHQPFTARTRSDAVEERTSGPASGPTLLTGVVEPEVEAVVLRCLAPDPAMRPSTAAEVAAALPGGDPLAAALAAGETPSPEQVAAAPSRSALRPAVAVAGVLFCLVTILGAQWMKYHYLISPDGRPPVALADRAAEMLRELGHPVDEHDTAWGYGRPATPAARPMFSTEQVEQMANGEAPPYFTFWLRSAPGSLMPEARVAVSPNDPPRARPGAALVQLATDGSLIGLEVWPDRETRNATEPVPWNQLLEMAGLDIAALREVAPHRSPMFADALASWEGTYERGAALRVDAAAVGGRVVWMRVFSPERGPEGLVLEALPETFLALLYTLFLGVLVGGVWLARSNLRNGRGDRRGAWRVSIFVATTWFLAFVMRASHGLAVAEFLLIYRLLSTALLVGVLTGVLYLGLEPLLRRHWPHRIVSWARVLEGRFNDPLVGRDLFLAGVLTAGVGHADTLAFLLGQAARGTTQAWSVLIPDGTGWRVADIISGWPLSMSLGTLQGFGLAVLLLVAARILRHDALGGLLVAVAMAVGLAMRDQVTDPVLFVGLLIQCALMVMMMLRFGLLMLVTLVAFANLAIMYPTTRFAESWFANGSTVLAMTVPLLAAYGAWAATRCTASTSAAPGKT